MLNDAYVYGITTKICMNVIIIKIMEVEKIMVVEIWGRRKEEILTGVHKEYFWVWAIFCLFLDHGQDVHFVIDHRT